MAMLKRVGYHVTDSLADVVTVAAGKAIRVVSIQAANVDGASSAAVSVLWTDAGDSDEPFYLAEDVPIEPGDSAGLLAADLFLTAADKIRAVASASGDIDLSISYWEFDQA